jgi:trimethylamine--corrinoid protein Co-methyltransferase
MSRLKILSDSEITKIHQATLRILSEVGVILMHSRGREILFEAGAQGTGDRVLLPPDLVEREVARCPARVTLRGRGGGEVTLGDGQMYWHNLGGAREVYNPTKDQRTPATVQDIRATIRLLDALDQATSITPFYTPLDVPGALMSLMMYRHTLPNTTKPVHGPGVQRAAEVRYLAHMAATIGEPKEMLTIGISPISPLNFPDDITAAILETAHLGIPLGPLPCPTAGATAPMSMAGALAQQNAEVLASIVLAQLIHPGLPVFYCGRLAMLEPHSGSSVWGGVELGLVSAATVQIGHFYNLPVNVYGFSTNAHRLEIQNGYERALNAVIPALAGADELSGIGEMEAGVMGSNAQMVIDNEIAAGIQRLLRGFQVNEDSLAIELVGTVMDGLHNFLSEEHTVRYLRSGEMLLARLAERRSWDVWDQSGRQGMAERAQARAEHLLATHQIPPLSEFQEKELDQIISAAQQELASRS